MSTYKIPEFTASVMSGKSAQGLIDNADVARHDQLLNEVALKAAQNSGVGKRHAGLSRYTVNNISEGTFNMLCDSLLSRGFKVHSTYGTGLLWIQWERES